MIDLSQMNVTLCLKHNYINEVFPDKHKYENRDNTTCFFDLTKPFYTPIIWNAMGNVHSLRKNRFQQVISFSLMFLPRLPKKTSQNSLQRG